MKKFTIIFSLFLFIFLLYFIGCNKKTDSKDDTSSEQPKALFLLTDDVNEELSVLQVELTELTITDTQNNNTTIFSISSGDEPFILNLINLDNLNNLLASSTLEPGLYKKITLSYRNAVALDNQGHTLNVLPQHCGKAKVLLNPYLEIESENEVLQIDFDLNNSVFNIVAESHGSIMFMPTLIVKVELEQDPYISEYKGTVTEVGDMSLVITHNNSTITINLTNTTILELDEIIIQPQDSGFDLKELIKVGNTVEVYGTLDTETNSVTAERIERKFENHGLESQGIVTEIGQYSFRLLVLDPRDSGFNLGSTQTIYFDNDTFFLYTDPCKSASPEHLEVGQDIRVTGYPDDPSAAQKVKLRETKLLATINSVQTSTITVNVISTEGISVDELPNFSNPVTVEFSGSFPSDIASGDDIELEGHFNYNTMGIFTARDYEKVIDEDDDTDDGEGGDGHTWVGRSFSVISTSPLKIKLIRGEDKGNTEHRTVTVLVNSDTVIFEKYRNTTTMISPSELANGINSDKYRLLKAEGEYNKANNTLTAKKIRADLKN